MAEHQGCDLMLPGGTDVLYRNALATSHRMTSRVEVWDGYGPGATQLNGDLPFLAGSVTATLNSRVTRTLQFSIDQSFYPVLDTGILAPYGNVIRAYRGIEMGDGSTTYVFPVFVGLIQDASLEEDGVVRVRASDLGAEVVAFDFEAPENSSAGVLIPTEVRRLISDALPGITFGTFDVYSERVQALTWDQDRAAALDELASTVGSFWYQLATGEFVLRLYPWTAVSAPVATLADGDGGVMTRWKVTRDRTGVYNSVTVTGERLNGDPAVFATARDQTPGSPTGYGSNFGIRTRRIRLQNPASQGAAQTAANDALRRDIALVESWEWSQTPDAALELGDVVTINAAGRTGVVQVVDSLVMPLDLSGAMRVSARSLIVPTLQQSG